MQTQASHADITYRQFNGTTGDIGGMDIDVEGGKGGVTHFTHASPANMVCSTCASCGATLSDWAYETNPETNQKVALPRVNHIRHAKFHARLGF